MELTWGLVVNVILGLGAVVIAIWGLKRPIWIHNDKGLATTCVQADCQFYLLVLGVFEGLVYFVWGAIKRGFGPPPEHLLFLLVAAVAVCAVTYFGSRIQNKRSAYVR
ncbi:MAG: hypothetical protein NT039_02905 [Candidatus Berkelbacteria bacterium]|nr:hypothetical protein [Candidatus Berkelbacteria bacterium]